MNNRSARQLSALKGVADELETAGIEYRLFGGWAVDFHAGRLTREHDDIDVAVWSTDAERISALLQRRGWKHAPELDEDGGTGFERDGVRLELTYLAPAADGSVHIPLRTGPARWPAAARAPVTVELRGVRTQAVPLDALARDKSRTRADPEDAAKDRADAAVLAEAMRRG